MSKNRWLLLLLSLIIIAVGIKLYRSYSSNDLGKIVLAENITPVSAPVTVARVKDYFKEEGIQCQTIPFASGRLALDALIGGKANFATVAETPIVLASMQGQPITVLCTFTSSEKNTKILARKDKGVQNPNDLIGKKIAVTFGTNGAYYLQIFLRTHNIRADNVQLINLSPPDMATAISRGDVDAICTWEPHIWNAKKLVGDEAVVLLNNPGIYTQTFNIVAMKGYTSNNDKILTGFLKALNKSVIYIKEHEDEAIAIVARENNMTETDLRAIWNDYVFDVVLDTGLVKAITGQAEWALNTNLATPESHLPPMEQLLTPGPLKSLKLESVNLQ